MYDALQLGPFTIQLFWIISFFSFLATYFILDGLLKESTIKKFMKQYFWTVVFIIFITYKFSVVLFQPHLLLTFRWFFLTGGKSGIYLGLCLSLIFLVWNMVRERIVIKHFVFGLIILTTVFLGTFLLVKLIVLSVM
ncbi:hypothetical protein [Metabacillus sp. B2-18]|uniref:hypothetical protein n=1 Tax=Metabacillus sp. B2-18 TaxID=2897333 RepID=UPI000BFC8AC2|nr:hypothetical protein [Metabacillus sp. B2-18]PGT81341.1 hypothetical protein COD11_18025 [Bacillus sp. AFS040349]UGB32854.1 hypothetical protein LPC09_10685 [Metabacillus sp. B2-18]